LAIVLSSVCKIVASMIEIVIMGRFSGAVMNEAQCKAYA